MLMLRGAELILIPNVCEMELNFIAQVRTRAIENMVAIALANYAQPDANGHSIAFDPIAFTEKDSRDSLVIEAGELEGVYLACFDLDAIRENRTRESWGNAFRKPHRYGLLVEQRVEDPFVRVNIHGEPYQSSMTEMKVVMPLPKSHVVPVGTSLACLSIRAPTHTRTAAPLVRSTMRRQDHPVLAALTAVFND